MSMRRAAQRHARPARASRPGTNTRNQAAVGVERRAGCRRRACSRSGRRSRSTSASCRRRGSRRSTRSPPLTSCVPSAARRRACCETLRGQLTVVALFRIGRVEVRRVVLRGRRARPRSCRASGTASRRCALDVPPAFSQLPVLLRVLRRRERARPEHAAPRAPHTAGSASTASSTSRGSMLPRQRRLHQVGAVVDERCPAACGRWRACRSASPRSACCRCWLVYGMPVCGERALRGRPLDPRAAEEPQRDRARSGRRQSPRRSATACWRASCRATSRTASRRSRRDWSGSSGTRPENRLPPLRVITLTTPPPKRPYSAEIAGRQDLDFLDRLLDEQRVRLAEHVVVDVDAVHQEDVVVGEAAADRHLIVVRRVVGEAGRQLGERRTACGRPAAAELLARAG